MEEGKQWKKANNGKRQATKEDKQWGEGDACTCSECGHVPAVAPTDTMHPMQMPAPCTPCTHTISMPPHAKHYMHPKQKNPMHPVHSHNMHMHMHIHIHELYKNKTNKTIAKESSSSRNP